MADEIIRELWKIKDGIANEHGNDIRAFVSHLRAKKHKTDQQVVDLRSMKQAVERGIPTDRQQHDDTL